MTPKLTAIGSGKGGTGKTLMATALASILARMGERVLLCDADFSLPNATLQLGLASGGDLAGFMTGRVRLDEAAVCVASDNEPCANFDLMAAPSRSCEPADFDVRAAQRLVARLRNTRCYDRILFDLGAGIAPATTTVAAHADETLLVLTNDPAALTDAYAFAKIVLKLCGGNVKFVVNMTENAAEAQHTADAFSGTCRAFLKTTPNYLGSIPRDPRATAAIRLQRPLVTMYPQAPATKAMAVLAQQIHGLGPRPQRLSVVQAPH